MLVLCCVIADDFTGACDAGVQFRKYGLKTAVLTHRERLDDLKGNFDVLVINTESRNVTPEVAYNRVRETVKSLREVGAWILFKKIDSTLRGNLGAELNAVVDELDLKAAIVAPALPAHNRTITDGYLYVRGIRLESTEFAQDPLHPVKESNIAVVIGRQTRRRIGNINLSKVRSKVESLKREFQRMIEDGNQIIVVDAEDQEDLARIARASADSDLLLCGSAGLAAEVSHLLTMRFLGSTLLVVSGSVNSVTLNQIMTAEKELNVRVLQPRLPEGLTSEQGWKTEVRDLVIEAEKAASEGRDIIIRLADSKSLISKAQKLDKELGMIELQVAEKLLSILGEASKKFIENYKIRGLILVGGDTSTGVINAINADGIEVEEEILPGIPMGRIIGGKFDGLRVVTKAGGFGDDYALVNIMRSLKGKD